ncbi:HNH endonuclease [Schaalia sp. 19OD2882]|uniref:HNH endonuclease family protein n=1 Tax=Schaalia sp. 19OD2882 TaxID=2794089 RepID=UPI001C1EAE8D|nr:HNH endonuclease family protein [Schaalia sp. 19OD2882]QWW19697.1 HNH endonuclease [Schaalia sp. 19OD2882]
MSGRGRRGDVLALVFLAVALVTALGPPPAADMLGLGRTLGWTLPLPWSGPDRPALERLPTTSWSRQLRALEVRVRSPAPAYQREAFGQRWADADRNGCDTRNDILGRDLARPRFKAGTNDCVVVSGTLAEPYTGAVVEFTRGAGTSDMVQVDHVVALADAWRSGAWQWDAATRERFANDPENLLAVDGRANRDKGASSADEWMPPDAAFHCTYARTQIQVKHRWALSVTAAEREALASALLTCPSK